MGRTLGDTIHEYHNYVKPKVFRNKFSLNRTIAKDLAGEMDVPELFRIVPRSDDNDIHPGDTYELRYWDDNNTWTSCGIKVADSNVLHYDSIPQGALIWITNHTRGMDERAFLIDEKEKVEWW